MIGAVIKEHGYITLASGKHFHPAFWDMYKGNEPATAKHQTIGKNIAHLAFERNGGLQYFSCR